MTAPIDAAAVSSPAESLNSAQTTISILELPALSDTTACEQFTTHTAQIITDLRVVAEALAVRHGAASPKSKELHSVAVSLSSLALRILQSADPTSPSKSVDRSDFSALWAALMSATGDIDLSAAAAAVAESEHEQVVREALLRLESGLAVTGDVPTTQLTSSAGARLKEVTELLARADGGPSSLALAVAAATVIDCTTAVSVRETASRDRTTQFGFSFGRAVMEHLHDPLSPPLVQNVREESARLLRHL